MRLLFAPILLAAASAASAATIYSTFGPGQTFFHSAFVIGGFSRQEIASPFTPAATYQLDSIDLAGFHTSGPNQLTVYLTAGPTQPGTAIESFSLTSLPMSATILTVQSALHPLLVGGVQYWIVLSANDLTNTEDEWNYSLAAMGESVRDAHTGMWTSTNGTAPAFDVNGSVSVPEPRMSWVLVPTLVIFLLRSRKYQQ